METTEGLEPLRRLRKDILIAGSPQNRREARYLVDLYYQIQEFRKAAGNQVRSMDGEPTNVLEWAFDSMSIIEREIAKVLDRYSADQFMGRWARGVIGIGPIIAAGLLAHIDLAPWKCVRKNKRQKSCTPADQRHGPECGPRPIRTVGAIWRFAGQDPTSKWKKGQRRPWNASLKTLCWKIGESFVKVSGNPRSKYGALYSERKREEERRNEAGEYKEEAARILKEKEFDKTTEAYKHYIKGKLPLAHLHARAKRWTVKIFLYHWFAQAYRVHYGEEPPMPYVIEHLGHVDFIDEEAAKGYD